MESDSINFSRAFAIIRRRGLLILFCAIAVCAAAFIVSNGEPDEYTATSSLAFNQDSLATQITGLVPATSGALLAAQQSNVELVERGSMSANTARQLGQGLSESDVRDSIEVSGNPESNIVGVSATATSPRLAAEIATTYAADFVKQRQGENAQFFNSALKLIGEEINHMPEAARFGPAAAALQNRAQDLRLLRGLGFSDVRVAQKATAPSSPSAPEVSKDTVIGGLIGLLIGIGLAFLLERRARERRIREPGELEALYNLPLLGAIPESEVLSERIGPGRGVSSLSPKEADALNLLRAHLRLVSPERAPGALLLTAPARGEGTSTTALCLAETMAGTGSRVLLLELDLRAPSLAARLGLTRKTNLVDVLTGSASMQDAIQPLSLGSSADEGATRFLDVLACGTTQPQNPAELVEGAELERILDYARSAYDLVVIDAPPLMAAPEVYAVLARVDGVIAVNRAGCSRRDLSLRLRDAFEGSGANRIGVIASRVRGRDLDAYGGTPVRAGDALPPIRADLGNGASRPSETAAELGS